MIAVDWNKLSDWGIIYKINNEVLHPLGLALSRNPETGISELIYISDDLVWEYDEDSAFRNEEKLKDFLINREEILKELLKDN